MSDKTLRVRDFVSARTLSDLQERAECAEAKLAVAMQEFQALSTEFEHNMCDGKAHSGEMVSVTAVRDWLIEWRDAALAVLEK